ncbi:MAG: cbb3-type cytochrome c oxidase subunit 3 [Bernardetiaceae bacterium]|nr:cbb3-type cytochrome c oxidase subunit 3 [Bernardetiaceae bacterium]
MYKEALRALENIEIFPIIGLVIFFGVFSFMIYMVIRMTKKNVDYLSNIPLNEDKTPNFTHTNEKS